MEINIRIDPHDPKDVAALLKLAVVLPAQPVAKLDPVPSPNKPTTESPAPQPEEQPPKRRGRPPGSKNAVKKKAAAKKEEPATPTLEQARRKLGELVQAREPGAATVLLQEVGQTDSISKLAPELYQTLMDRVDVELSGG